MNGVNDVIVNDKSIKHEMYSRNAVTTRFLVEIMEKSTNKIYTLKKLESI